MEAFSAAFVNHCSPVTASVLQRLLKLCIRCRISTHGPLILVTIVAEELSKRWCLQRSPSCKLEGDSIFNDLVWYGGWRLLENHALPLLVDASWILCLQHFSRALSITSPANPWIERTNAHLDSISCTVSSPTDMICTRTKICSFNTVQTRWDWTTLSRARPTTVNMAFLRPMLELK